MLLPAGWVVYAVLLLLGLIVGVLARYLLALAAALLLLSALGIALIGLFDPSALARIPELLGRLWNDLPVASPVLLTVSALVFLLGVLGGVLLTTPLRAFDSARSAS